MPRKKKISIIDVAEVAGVSRSTVSRVINNDPKASAPAVKAVRSAMDQLGYEPPPMEKRYRRPSRKPDGIRVGTIAMFFPDTDPAVEATPLSAALIHGAARALADNDLKMIVTHLDSPDQVPDAIVNREVDGVVLRGGTLSETTLRKIKKLPTVWLFESSRRILWGDQVFPDNRAAGQMAADWLVERGCRHPLVLCMDAGHAAFRRRADSCFELLEEQIDGAEYLNLAGEGVRSSLAKVFGGSHVPDGMFISGHDNHMLQVYLTLQGLDGDHAAEMPIVTCVNNAATLTALNPAIANVDIRPEELARTAVETLLWRMKNPRDSVRTIMLTPQLIDPSAAGPQ